MSRRVALPPDDDLAAALHALLADAAAQGVRPTVLTLAGRLGLSNTTFWRHFPDTAQQVRAAANQALPRPDIAVDDPTGSAAAASNGAQQRAVLSRDNQRLREQLELASAHIARLTLTNQRLVEELETATRVTPLFSARHPSTTSSDT